MIFFPTLWYGLSRDQGTFSHVGELILQGETPYRDTWQNGFPAIFLTYAAIIRLLGTEAMGVRIADILFQLGAVGALTAAARTLLPSPIPLAAALWYAALYVRSSYWVMAQAESFANTFALLGFGLAVCQRRKSPIALFTAPVCLGAAIAYKPPLVIAYLPLLLLVCRRSQEVPKPAFCLGFCLVGLLLPTLACLFWMAKKGCLDDFLDIQRRFTPAYVSMRGLGLDTFDVVFHYGLPILYAFFIPFSLAIIGAFGSRSTRANDWHRFLVFWAGTSLLSLLLQRRMFLYHFLPLFIPLALLAPLGLQRIACRLSPFRLAAMTIAAPLIWIAVVRGAHYYDFARFLAGQLPPRQWYAQFGQPGKGDYSYLAQLDLADYIRRTTKPDDPVYIWGFEPYVYVKANRYPPTRFSTTLPIASTWADRDWYVQFLQDLQKRPPRLFVMVRHDLNPLLTGWHEDSATQLRHFPALQRFLAENYAFAAQIEDYVIYRYQGQTTSERR